MPLTVTFDTGALNDVVWPEDSQQPTDPADAAERRAPPPALLWPDPCDSLCPVEFMEKARKLLPQVPLARSSRRRPLGAFDQVWLLAATPLKGAASAP